ncbi:MAG: CarD family transcriptional regulator [Deltaproteobacteria bacterium RBG_13_51_10]|jgi:CarD family transcriptional regulator|nr:MAG: CarD family transcriptional regulator [Deltaproteobacteria bacterium RBG_13_51_10]
MFKIGDKAVYPAHGVGIIEDIKCKVISGNKRTFYVLRILEKEMTIMIPTDNAESVGLRGIIDKKEVSKVFRILSERNGKIDCQTWNRRYREYMEKIKSGSVFEVAEVLRDLVHLKNDKDLSFGERQMLDLAQNLLVKELSIAKNMAEDKVRLRLLSIFNI